MRVVLNVEDCLRRLRIIVDSTGRGTRDIRITMIRVVNRVRNVYSLYRQCLHSGVLADGMIKTFSGCISCNIFYYYFFI